MKNPHFRLCGDVAFFLHLIQFNEVFSKVVAHLFIYQECGCLYVRLFVSQSAVFVWKYANVMIYAAGEANLDNCTICH